MNRSEKRRLKRSNNDESMLLTYLEMSDPCIVAALDDHGLNINEISDVLKTNSEYLQDYTKYIEIEGGFGMIKNEELMSRVKTKIRRCMEGKMDKAKALKILKNEFNLPTAVLSDLWIECKVVKKGSPHDADMGTSLDHDERLITSIEEYDEVNTPAKASINNVVSEKEIVSEVTCGLDIDENKLVTMNVPNVNVNKPINMNVPNRDLNTVKIDCDRDRPVEIKKNNLIVLNRIVQVRGQYGTYTKSNDGVSIDAKLYKDKIAISNNKKILAESYKEEITDIQKEIDKLITKLREVENSGIREIEQLTELESVFDMSF